MIGVGLPQRSRRRRKWEHGQAIVEFGLVAVAFFLLVFGIIDVARLMQSWVTVQHAAREAARYAITGQITCDEYTSGSHRADCIIDTAKRATSGMNGGGETGTAVSVLCRYWGYPDYTDPSTPATATTCASDNIGSQCDAVEVDVEYTHHFITPMLEVFAPSGIEVHGRQRMINEPFGPCT